MYTHGQIIMPSGEPRLGSYRINNKTKNVEFVLWRTGEQGHKSPYWHPTGLGWSELFVAGYPSEQQKAERLEF